MEPESRARQGGGWSERARRRKHGLSFFLTPNDYARLATDLQEGLDRFAIRADTATPIGRILRETKWLASLDADPFGPGGARERESERFDNAILRLPQALDLGWLLLNASEVENSEEKIRRYVRRLPDRVERYAGQPQEHFFELSIAVRLAQLGRTARFRVSLEEPDVVIRFPEGTAHGYACKQPRTLNAIPGIIEEASGQIRHSPQAGMIIVGLDTILHRDTTAAETTIRRVPKLEDGKALANDLIAQAREAAAAPARLLPVHVGGILLFGALTYFVDDGPGPWSAVLTQQTITDTLPNPEIPGAQRELDALRTILCESYLDRPFDELEHERPAAPK